MDASRRRFVGLCLAAPVLANDGTSSSAQRSDANTAWPSSFPALRQTVHGRPLTYLDSAATTLRPQSVIDALVHYHSLDNANPSRAHTLASRAADHLAAARQTVARFINAADASEIVFVRGTTEGVNLVASAWGPTTLRSGDEIVISIAEHSSNLMPWTRLARERGATVRVVDVTDEGRLEPQAVEKALSTRSRIVALTHVSNVLGAVNPIKEICALAHAAGARVVVDGAQGVPHVKIDVRDLGCDFYIFSGHKMLGPMATGVLWGRRELLDSMPPYHVGSNMAHAVELDRAEFEHGAQKFQAGTPDVAGPVGLAAAIRFFEEAGGRRLVSALIGHWSSTASNDWQVFHDFGSSARAAPTNGYRCSPSCSRGARRWTLRARSMNKGLRLEPATWQRCPCSSASTRRKPSAHRRTSTPLCGTSTNWLTRCTQSGSEAPTEFGAQHGAPPSRDSPRGTTVLIRSPRLAEREADMIDSGEGLNAISRREFMNARPGPRQEPLSRAFQAPSPPARILVAPRSCASSPTGQCS